MRKACYEIKFYTIHRNTLTLVQVRAHRMSVSPDGLWSVSRDSECLYRQAQPGQAGWVTSLHRSALGFLLH